MRWLSTTLLVVVGTGGAAIPDELPVDGPGNSPAPGDQDLPSAAWNGTNTLVVWNDHRSGTPGVYAARLAPSGTVLDVGGLVVHGGVVAGRPVVAASGSDWLVAWTDGAARVSGSGTLLDTSPIPLPGAPTGVAGSATGWLVVYTTTMGGGSDVHGARVDRTTGELLDPMGIPISASAGANESLADVASNGSSYFVVWEDDRNLSMLTGIDIYGTRVGMDGVVLDTAGVPVSRGSRAQTEPRIASDGTDYFAAWDDFRTGTSYDAYGARISAAGVTLDPAGILIAAGGGSYPLDVAGSASGWFVSGPSGPTGNTIYAVRLTGGGAVLDAPPITLATSAPMNRADPTVSPAGTGWLGVWTDERFAGTPGLELVGTRVSSEGTILDPMGLLVAATAAEEASPAITHGPSQLGVAWVEPGRKTIRMSRIDSLGALLDPLGIDVNASPPWTLFYPGIAFDGTNYLVVWATNLDGVIRGSRVTSGGLVLDTGLGLPLSSASIIGPVTGPHVAFGGGVYLVNFFGSFGSGYGVIVSPDGMTGGTFSIGPAGGTEGNCSFDGTNFVCVWLAAEFGLSWAKQVYGTRVSPAGTVLDPGGFPIATGDMLEYHWHPRIASSPSGSLAVWYRSRSPEFDAPGVYAARISAGGVTLDPAAIFIHGVEEAYANPTVVWDGSRFLVSWVDTGRGSISGAYVTTAGVLDGSAFVIDSLPGAHAGPVMAQDGTGRVAVAYVRHDPAPGFSVDRVRMRFTDDTEPPVDAGVGGDGGGAPDGGMDGTPDGASVDGLALDSATPDASAGATDSASAGDAADTSPGGGNCDCRVGARRARSGIGWLLGLAILLAGALRQRGRKATIVHHG